MTTPFIMCFQAMQREVYETATTHGWWSAPVAASYHGEKIALMHSELSEALESLRSDEPPDKHLPQFTATEVELADVIIRIMDYAEHRGLRIAEALEAKAAFNETRPYMHGGKAF